MLPLRFEVGLADQLYEAWRRHGLRGRMDLFRVALRSYLASLRESDLAESVAKGRRSSVPTFGLFPRRGRDYLIILFIWIATASHATSKAACYAGPRVEEGSAMFERTVVGEGAGGFREPIELPIRVLVVRLGLRHERPQSAEVWDTSSVWFEAMDRLLGGPSGRERALRVIKPTIVDWRLGDPQPLPRELLRQDIVHFCSWNEYSHFRWPWHWPEFWFRPWHPILKSPRLVILDGPQSRPISTDEFALDMAIDLGSAVLAISGTEPALVCDRLISFISGLIHNLSLSEAAGAGEPTGPEVRSDVRVQLFLRSSDEDAFRLHHRADALAERAHRVETRVMHFSNALDALRHRAASAIHETLARKLVGRIEAAEASLAAKRTAFDSALASVRSCPTPS